MAMFRKYLVIALVFGLATGSAHAGDTLKLRPIQSGYVDGKGAGLNAPEGVGSDGKSLLVVADTGNGRLVRYNIAGGSLVPGDAISLTQLPYPVRVRVNSKGEIFALDGKLRKIARISPSGEFKGYVDPTGMAGQRIMVPRSLQIDSSDNLYILDVSSARVLVLDPEGKFQREIPFPKGYGFFSDFALDAGGNLFFVDSVQRKIFTAPKGTGTISPLTEILKEDFNFPVSIAADNRGNLLVVDQNGSGIAIFGLDGSYRGRQSSMGWKEGFLRYPSQICVTGNGFVFIADRGNNRIQMYSTQE